MSTHFGGRTLARSQALQLLFQAEANSRAVLDVLDGEYIVAGFQQAYGIDLTDPALEMHWHRFKALAQALPESTLMAQIVGWRTAKAPSRRADPEREAARMRRRWALPEPGAEREERAVIEMQRRLFGGIEPAPFRARRG